MKKLIKISLLAILLSSCASYKEESLVIDGELQKVLVADNKFAQIEGIRAFEGNPKGLYDGMLFIVEPDTAFTTKGVKHYLLICSLKRGKLSFKTVKCKCLKPDIEKYYPNSVYVYERLFSDKDCKNQIKL